ncbi:3-dehydroquinate synthase [Patiriisocius sp. Uisw_017]|jgi:3-dehydroquinate synthase|uniref:3-dehydroquinate synthase n=1 Tax=Patiriisocius sp. Uisw_017 TaxID=3230968 RepID=UPI0039E7E2D7
MLKIKNNKSVVYAYDGAWEALQTKINELNPSSIFVLTDDNTKKHCIDYFNSKVNPPCTSQTLTVTPGEEYKNIDTCMFLWEMLSEKGADRSSLIINLGGGVITDMGGFVGATFRRGISFINIPTTLLAMVDAAIGGKNGVDLGNLKNQIGTIKNPEVVLIDTHFLATLPKEEITSGYAEMLKHGIISSKKYWNQLKGFDLLDTKDTQQLIWDSIVFKNEVVQNDPFEDGSRKSLNFGHSLGHAIESYFLSNQDKRKLLHGEAIAIGMVLATYISSVKFDFPKEQLYEITKTILTHFKKPRFTKDDIDEVISLLKYDKKNNNGRILFILLEDYGVVRYNCEVENDLLFDAFKFYKNFTQ